MRIGPPLLLAGALTLGACASSSDVESTSSFSNQSGERLPDVDEVATTTTAAATTTTTAVAEPPPTASSTTVPGTRPVDVDSKVLLASDLPGWEVGTPMSVPAEPTWQSIDCPDMNTAWETTGLAGVRSRGTNGGASFRNTAVELDTPEAASDVLDAVDRVWTDCPMIAVDLESSFWSEPIVMPRSTHTTAGIVIGNADFPSWTLAYWQVDSTVVVLEVEGDEMWTYVDLLMTTLSERLDGNPAPVSDPGSVDSVPVATSVPGTPSDEAPPTSVFVPAIPVTTTTVPAGDEPHTEPSAETFPPPLADWADHPLAHLAPSPAELGAGWNYEYGRRNEAEPADPEDAIDDCDGPIPPNLDGFDIDYRNAWTDEEVSIMVGDGAPAESQIWIEAFRALTECDLFATGTPNTFDVAQRAIAGADDAIIIAGDVDFGTEPAVAQALGAARVDGVLVAVFSARTIEDEHSLDDAIDRVDDVLQRLVDRI
ncbi:hypothetical protein [Ilumatobacter coccineus]|uniref:Sensor domain-containing protein n=1 Tax=Ilumatobacter coccineus (strain NBRC 103263 / KCTC 29153 / YM16-304) TaxID=1313172 RepID=A0A6C7E7L6_ILUCY|nr:hypothetical protein [Ilumatobacter coccineus]BAN02052.1 hypothetical protein YM304_17380 [Ilumatobacter coccineus YM16-304]